MPKRGGLGQRGLDLLISASSGRTDSAAAEDSVLNEKQTGDKSKKAKDTKGADGKSSAKSLKKAASGTKTAQKKSGAGSRTGSTAAVNSTATKKAANAKNRSANDNKMVANGAEMAETGTGMNTASAASNEPLQVPIELIEPNREQPRKNFDEDSLQELADSIRQFGVIQPLIVQKKEDYYEIVAGERRWRASRIAGLKTLPVIVKEYTTREVMEISLIENIQREDLNPIEEALAYKNLMEEYDLHQDEVAQRVSRSRAAIANSVRLLNLDRRVQDMVVSEMLSTGHARALLALTDPDLQYSTAQRVFDEKMSVREVEKLVRQLTEKAPKTEKKKPVSETLLAVYAGMEEEMKSSLGTKVTIAAKSAQKGRIEIEYYSSDELDRLCQILKTPVQEIRG